MTMCMSPKIPKAQPTPPTPAPPAPAASLAPTDEASGSAQARRSRGGRQSLRIDRSGGLNIPN